MVCKQETKVWSKSKVSRILKRIPEWHWEKIIDMYWEYIPKGDYSEKDKMRFILYSIPNGASFSDDIIEKQLRVGPEFVNSRAASNAKPRVLDGLKEIEKSSNEEYISKAIKKMSMMKQLDKYEDPIVKNEDWIMMCVLAEVFDDYSLAYADEDVYDSLKKWCNKVY